MTAVDVRPISNSQYFNHTTISGSPELLFKRALT